MIPGVGCQRRRRISNDATRNSSCSLSQNVYSYSSRWEFSNDTKLHEALEARNRLEKRLRNSSTTGKEGGYICRPWRKNPDNSRRLSGPNGVFDKSFSNTGTNCSGSFVRTGVYTQRSKFSMPFRKAKSGTLQENDCAVCLECFKHNEAIAYLPCGHKFHSSCLVPWLKQNCVCPCCRAKPSS